MLTSVSFTPKQKINIYNIRVFAMSHTLSEQRQKLLYRWSLKIVDYIGSVGLRNVFLAFFHVIQSTRGSEISSQICVKKVARKKGLKHFNFLLLLRNGPTWSWIQVKWRTYIQKWLQYFYVFGLILPSPYFWLPILKKIVGWSFYLFGRGEGGFLFSGTIVIFIIFCCSH